MSFEKLKEIYSAAGQSQVFAFYDSLDEYSQKSLLSQLATIDPARVTRIADTVLSPAPEAGPSEIVPLPDTATASVLTAPASQIEEWEAKGISLIAQNSVAVVLLAGGQGTRLGSTAPKGCFDIDLPSHKSLFELQAERILSLQKLVGNRTGKTEIVIPWYIMTSGPTRAATETFFSTHNYFGLNPANIMFFEQGVLPCIDNSGKILLERKDKAAVAPDGNGGIYRALVQEGVLLDFAKRGIHHVHAYCVDNCLVRMADPVFLGFASSRNVLVATKSVPKRAAKENVGLIVAKGGHPAVIEYSEISEEMANRIVVDSESGKTELAFRTANIVNHYYSVEYLNSIATWPDNYLPYHIARKKIPYVDLETGESISPSKPNGIKMEQFIFDCFPQLEIAQFANLEVRREDEFSPLKNKVGTVGEDDANTSRADLLKQGKRWVVAAGATVSDSIVGVEVPPLTSYAGENLEFVKGKSFSEVTVVEL
ncbi:nucleotide-diphospho-sugar transferase [Lipomyces orientalis]|uniref:Nucleotide-diphospho-sugar transferase n=1 Tax=Lipomyces orientalis TaxID=1233043 RepID=A0ACC3TEW3_9ASCO